MVKEVNGSNIFDGVIHGHVIDLVVEDFDFNVQKNDI